MHLVSQSVSQSVMYVSITYIRSTRSDTDRTDDVEYTSGYVYSHMISYDFTVGDQRLAHYFICAVSGSD